MIRIGILDLPKGDAVITHSSLPPTARHNDTNLRANGHKNTSFLPLKTYGLPLLTYGRILFLCFPVMRQMGTVRSGLS